MNPELAPSGNPEFAGAVAAPEPRAAAMGRDAILAGGNAADAAAIMGLVLSVTLPSRMSVHAVGQCLVVDPTRERSEVIDFSSAESRAVLSSVRGLAALHARYGRQNWATLVAAAENLARFGFPVSTQLADDLHNNSQALVSDAAALKLFLTARHTFFSAGETLVLANLASVLADMRTNALGPATPGPQWREAQRAADGAYLIHQAGSLANARGGALVDGTGFVVGDKSGMAISCAFSIGAPFGAGALDNRGAALMPMLPHGNFATMMATDVRYGQIVFATAVSGSGTAEGMGVVQGSWQTQQLPDRDTQARLQSLADSVSLSAIKCDTGLGVLGRECLTINAPDGVGLGMTFAQE